MNATVKDKCDLFLKNRDILQKIFKWENANMILAGSSFYTGLGHEALIASTLNIVIAMQICMIIIMSSVVVSSVN